MSSVVEAPQIPEKVSTLLENSTKSETLPAKDKERLESLREELSEPSLSKNRRKKIYKEIQWVASRKERNSQKKEERKKRRKAITEGDQEPRQKRQKICRMIDSKCQIKVALDMELHEFMTEPERTKTMRQVQRCYALNRRTENPLQLSLTGLAKASELLKSFTGFENWDINRIDKNHYEHFGRDKVVYLTGDSENEITELSEDEVYVIGAMVDHNRHKGITHQRAIENNVRHARLPLDKYVDLKSRKVLTIDHCFQILVLRANGVPWQTAILDTIPARKGAQAKGGKTESADESSSADEQDDSTALVESVTEETNGKLATVETVV